MPVLIFGGIEDLDLFLPLATRLRSAGGEVRCYLDDDSYELRNIGCKIAVGRLDDDANLEGALTNVHTFIPFLPDPILIADETAAKEMLELARGAVRAVQGSGIAQTVVALPAFDDLHGPIPGAYADARDEFIEQLGPLCTILTGFLWGPARPFTRMVSALPSDGTASVTRVEDLTEILAAADDREQIDGVWEFASPPLTLSELKSAAPASNGFEPPSWVNDVVSRGFSVGSSASEELGIAARSVL